MSPELSSALRAVETMTRYVSAWFCRDRRPKHLRRYLALCVRDFGADSDVAAKARRLLADAEQVAELERMAGL